MKVIVLGVGRVGKAIVADLVEDPLFEVTAADISPVPDKAAPADLPVRFLYADLSDPRKVKSLVADHDLVIDALPSSLGYQTCRAVIESGKLLIDIAFFSEDPWELDGLAKEKGITAIVDCGVAPGMSNILAGYVHSLLDETHHILIYVGGLPRIREWPYEYKAAFSPMDVIEEYIRPARYVENGVLVVRQALSDPELIYFPEVGTLEAFNTDGLRTLAKTMPVPNMKEKTLRYPGHIEKMAVLRDSGFFSKQPIKINGQEIKPLDFTARLLFPLWEMKEGDEDFTVMRIIVEGRKGSQHLRYTYSLFDCYDRDSKTTSMARTTGYTATVAARMLAKGLFTTTGIIPPEIIGKDPACVAFMLKELKARGVVYREKIEEIS